MKSRILWVALAAVAVCMAAEQSSSVPLSKALWLWKKDIESRGRGPIVLARAFTDREKNEMTLPLDTDQRELLRTYFLDPAFVAQFYRSHAMNVNTQGLTGLVYFVVLNMALASEWEGSEDAVIAHEFGHIDLATRGYPAWVHQTKGLACMDTQATDMAQHVLIREEIARRGIDYDSYWIRNLDAALAQLEKQAAPKAEVKEDACQSVARIALWADVRMGMPASKWKGRARFEEIMAAHWPAFKPAVDHIEERLSVSALWTQQRYMDALVFVRETVNLAIHPPAKSAL